MTRHVQLNSTSWDWNCVHVGTTTWEEVTIQILQQQTSEGSSTWVPSNNVDVDVDSFTVADDDIPDPRYSCTSVQGMEIGRAKSAVNEKFLFIDDQPREWDQIHASRDSVSDNSKKSLNQVQGIISDRPQSVEPSKENSALIPGMWQHVCASFTSESAENSFISIDGQNAKYTDGGQTKPERFTSNYKIILGQSPVGEWSAVSVQDTCYGFGE